MQDFEQLRKRGSFYVDKTDFIKEWWESGSAVTLITRPRRFGKTLNMSMLNCFFSNKYGGRGDLFDGLHVWEDKDLRELQGSYPVIFVTFAGVKAANFRSAVYGVKYQIAEIFNSYNYLASSEDLSENERRAFNSMTQDMSDDDAQYALRFLSQMLSKVNHGKKVLIFLDEYDTPLQEAWNYGYWEELVQFTRLLFNNTFKTNPYMERAVMTGITRVSRESLFSDLNNLDVCTISKRKYETCFGFTEEEVFAAMDEEGMDPKMKEEVKLWYDGFMIGGVKDIYNPWSITNFLDSKEFDSYWANTSSNALAGKLVREGDRRLKEEFETLLEEKSIIAEIDEQIVFSDLGKNANAVWSLLLASGYLKADEVRLDMGRKIFTLSLTNLEVQNIFLKLIDGWFGRDRKMEDFVGYMLEGDVEAMNYYMNKIALETFSFFDAAGRPSDRVEPERFYHGFVLGLMVEKRDSHILRSNRQSGFGRYDVMMEPKARGEKAVIIEFKVISGMAGEKSLSDTAQNALKQIDEKRYETELVSRGIPKEDIYKYAFAFRGQECLIVKG